MIGFVTAVKLREWRGAKPAARPAGAAITTRLRTTPEDEQVLDLVADHLGMLRRADLAAASRPRPHTPTLDDEARRQTRRDRLNTRKKGLTGRRAQGHKARRRKGVTRTRPEDRVVRATDQAAPDDRQVSTRNRHWPGMRGTESRPPSQASTRHLGRATVPPAPATNGQRKQ